MIYVYMIYFQNFHHNVTSVKYRHLGAFVYVINSLS